MEKSLFTSPQEFETTRSCGNVFLLCSPHRRCGQVRCRVFDGVICGSDIVKWMIASTNSHAHDQIEACLISQGLISAELLVPVTLGYRQLTDIDHEEVDLLGLPFSNDKGYVYRYPSGSKRTGLFTLFGAPVNITIPRWVQVDGDGNISAAGGKDSQGAPYAPRRVDSLPPVNIASSSPSTTATLATTSAAAGYVQYTVEVTVGDDRWEVFRRSCLPLLTHVSPIWPVPCQI
jgi:hypothetical protein